MPIPPLNDDGLLPEGIHVCAYDDAHEAFGRFQGSDRRSVLIRQLKAYLDELRAADVARYILVNGSFVTSVDRPNDIDLLVVLSDDVDLGETVPPFRYNVRSRRYVRKHWEFDVFFGYEGDESYNGIANTFASVKGEPGKRKGLLRIDL